MGSEARTGKPRTKRPDHRANYKARKKLIDKAAAEAPPKRPKKALERVVSGEFLKKKPMDADKVIRALNKKVRQCEELRARQIKGEILTKEQEEKIARLEQLKEERDEFASQFED